MGTRGAYGLWESLFIAEMKRLRTLRGISQSDLARRLRERGVSFHQQTVQKVESGERPVRLDEAYYIADELGTTVTAMTSFGDNSDSQEAVYAVERARRAADDMAHANLDAYSAWYEEVEDLLGVLHARIRREADLRPGNAVPDHEVSMSPLTVWLAAWGQKQLEVAFAVTKLDSRLAASGSEVTDILVGHPEMFTDLSRLLGEPRIWRSSNLDALSRLSSADLLALLDSIAEGDERGEHQEEA